MPAVKITNKPVSTPGDQTHFLVTQPELPEGYTPTGEETEEELDSLKVESLREVEMGSMAGFLQRKPVSFTEASERENIASGESLSTIIGKVKKWFADLKNAAFHTVANNYTTTEEGYVLDARLGPAIKAKMDLADTLNTKVANMNLYDYRKYASDSKTLSHNSWTTLTSITIPANDTHAWVYLAYADDDILDTHQAMIKTISTPDDGVLLATNKYYGPNGAGLTCWGYINPSASVDRIISLQMYGYRNNNSDTAHGRIYAFAIGDSR